MPRWVLTCSACTQEFTHTLIREVSPERESRDPFASPPKPRIPDQGLQVKCPNCGEASTYGVFDLRYRR
jgi:uncharacterized Zn finger protein